LCSYLVSGNYTQYTPLIDVGSGILLANKKYDLLRTVLQISSLTHATSNDGNPKKGMQFAAPLGRWFGLSEPDLQADLQYLSNLNEPAPDYFV